MILLSTQQIFSEHWQCARAGDTVETKPNKDLSPTELAFWWAQEIEKQSVRYTGQPQTAVARAEQKNKIRGEY